MKPLHMGKLKFKGIKKIVLNGRAKLKTNNIDTWSGNLDTPPGLV